MPIEKTSTHLYSINSLSSKIQHVFIPADDLEGKVEFDDVYQMLQNSEQFDVPQKVIENIMSFAKENTHNE